MLWMLRPGRRADRKGRDGTPPRAQARKAFWGSVASPNKKFKKKKFKKKHENAHDEAPQTRKAFWGSVASPAVEWVDLDGGYRLLFLPSGCWVMRAVYNYIINLKLLMVWYRRGLPPALPPQWLLGSVCRSVIYNYIM